MSKIGNLRPAKQYALAAALGMLGALAFPPINFIVAPFIAFPAWLYMLESNQDQSWKRHFSLGFWFALGYFTVGLYWITFALGVDLSIFWWLIPFSLFGIPTGLGVYVGIMSVLLKLTNSRGISRCFFFAALWTTGELAWGTGPMALPWNPLGSIWTGFEPMLQTLSIYGIYGLTLVTALLVSLPTLLRKNQFKPGRIAYITSMLCLFILASGWGIIRPTSTPVHYKENPPVVRLVQPYIPQDLNWQPARAQEQFRDLIQLSSEPGELKPNIIIWPESALPLLLGEDQVAREVVARMLPENGYLLSGSLRRERVPDEKMKIYNSLIMVGSDASVVATYDKHHLVQFGEYLPLRSIIPSSITKITSGDNDFSRGPGPATVSLDSIPSFSPLICFEGIFSGEVVAPGPRPEWLLNITNDTWYGNSSGPYQHLQLSRMRSIEEGLPMVRAVNSGISAVFDSFGQEIARKGLLVRGVLDVHLPPALLEPTIFAQYGHLIFMLMMVAVVGFALLTRRV